MRQTAVVFLVRSPWIWFVSVDQGTNGNSLTVYSDRLKEEEGDQSIEDTAIRVLREKYKVHTSMAHIEKVAIFSTYEEEVLVSELHIFLCDEECIQSKGSIHNGTLKCFNILRPPEVSALPWLPTVCRWGSDREIK